MADCMNLFLLFIFLVISTNTVDARRHNGKYLSSKLAVPSFTAKKLHKVPRTHGKFLSSKFAIPSFTPKKLHDICDLVTCSREDDNCPEGSCYCDYANGQCIPFTSCGELICSMDNEACPANLCYCDYDNGKCKSCDDTECSITNEACPQNLCYCDYAKGNCRNNRDIDGIHKCSGIPCSETREICPQEECQCDYANGQCVPQCREIECSITNEACPTSLCYCDYADGYCRDLEANNPRLNKCAGIDCSPTDNGLCTSKVDCQCDYANGKCVQLCPDIECSIANEACPEGLCYCEYEDGHCRDTAEENPRLNKCGGIECSLTDDIACTSNEECQCDYDNEKCVQLCPDIECSVSNEACPERLCYCDYGDGHCRDLDDSENDLSESIDDSENDLSESNDSNTTEE